MDIEIVSGQATYRDHGCCLCLDAGFVRRKRERYDPDFGRAVECECHAQSEHRRPFDPYRYGVPARLAEASFATWLPANGGPRIQAQQYIAGWPRARYILLLSGPVGRGKTHLAASVLRAAWEQHHKPGRFYVVPELMDRLRRTNDPERRTETADQIHAEFDAAPIVVLDDLGTEYSTGYAGDQLFQLINRRYGDMKPMVITTNLATANMDERLRSRIADVNAAVVIEIDGQRFPEHRRAA